MHYFRYQCKLRYISAFRWSVPRPHVFREPSTQKSGLREMEWRAAARSPATNLLVGRNSTVIPNNYLQLGREAKTFLHTRVRARRLQSGYIWPSPAAERGPRSSGPPAFRLQGGLPSLDTTRSRTDTYTRPSACNHPPRSPSFPRMTFRLSCCAGPRPGVSPR